MKWLLSVAVAVMTSIVVLTSFPVGSAFALNCDDASLANATPGTRALCLQQDVTAIKDAISGGCSDSDTKTNLLFTFITNQQGFYTGIAISNTGSDPFGTVGKSGACILSFFGASAPAPITTPAIASGTTFTTLASTSAPGFQGYMIAACDFPFAHGFAFISDLGARNLAMGYIPSNICKPRIPPQ
jgi:hypothetical protein